MSTTPPANVTQTDAAPAHRYTAALADVIETKWQAWWQSHNTFVQPNPGQPGFDASRPKFYCLDMFPYPSGAGLHVGHPEGYTGTDILCRFKRHQGFNVLHPMGWDAFGLPAEQYAIQTGVHPAITTKQAIDNFRRQLQRFGFCYDWSREVGTIDPGYYKWTQWIFVTLYDAWFDPAQKKARPIADLIAAFAAGSRPIAFNAAASEISDADKARTFGAWSTLDVATKRAVINSYRLAYQGTTTVNWCPKLGTVLANDEVVDGKSERGGYPVLRKPLKQWMFRITAYADRLLEQLSDLAWPESTKAMQREWIGRSEGAEIEFELALGTPDLRAGRTVDDLYQANIKLLKHPKFVARDPYPPEAHGPVADLVSQSRFLPHHRLPEATYFVTWRTQPGVTLNDDDCKQVLNALLHFQGERLHVFAAVVMPDHVHWLVKPNAGEELGELVASVKRFSATHINKARSASGSIWVPEAFDHIVRDERYLAEFVSYIVTNPLKAGLVDAPTAHEGLYIDPLVLAVAGGSSPGPEVRGTPEQTLTVFTTRPDTLFGATYMVVAPEHGLCARIISGQIAVDAATRTALAAYVTTAKNRSDVERQQDNKTKTGAFTGVHAINPATGKPIPVWTADYVLMGYGTGAIMAVPAHDERDFEFALAFDLPIDQVVTAEGTAGFRVVTRGHSLAHREVERLFRRNRGSSLQRAGHEVLHADFINQADAVRFANEIGIPNPSITGASNVGPRIPFEFPGIAMQSASPHLSIDGLPTAEAKATVIAWLESSKRGVRKINYKFRDWTFSRQRYWGEPFPVVFDEAGNHYPVKASHLPVILPELTDYAPVESDDPQPLLAKAGAWCKTTAGAAGVDPALLDPSTPVTRETNTMPGSAGSSWYFLRYCDPSNDKALIDSKIDAYWTSNGVDFYMGGSEHTVGHLLYSRFWQNALHDLGHVKSREPFHRLFHQGMITSFAYERADKSLVAVDLVDETIEGVFVERSTGKPVKQIVAKMSKSLKNVINPDDIIAGYGADTFRLYEMYMGPLEASKPWNTKDIIGPHRYLQRVWRNVVNEETGELTVADAPAPADLHKLLHRTIAGVTQDITNIALHTAIAKLIELNNALTKHCAAAPAPRSVIEPMLILLSPFCPHICEELWQKLGHTTSIADAKWPTFDPALLVDDAVEIAVQVLGKVRGKMMVPTNADAKAIEALAMADAAVQGYLGGKPVKKCIVVPGRLINFVV